MPICCCHARFAMLLRPVSLLSLLGFACIPYTVGNTAAPLPPGETQRSMSWYFIPNGIQLRDSVASTFTGLDFEYRRGLEGGASDVGVRIPSASGIVLSYKRRLTPGPATSGPIVALLVGAGIVNVAQHAHGEVGVMASAPERDGLVPYGGLRVMQVLPLSEGAASDSPTAGGFLGTRIGDRDFGVGLELGVYYDRSTLGIRRGTVIFVPALTLHGDELIRLLRFGR